MALRRRCSLHAAESRPRAGRSPSSHRHLAAGNASAPRASRSGPGRPRGTHALASGGCRAPDPGGRADPWRPREPPPPRPGTPARSPGALSAPASRAARLPVPRGSGSRAAAWCRRRGPDPHASPPGAAPKGQGLPRPVAGGVWPSVGAVAPSLCGHRRTFLTPLRPSRHGERLPPPSSVPTPSARNSALPLGVRDRKSTRLNSSH